MSIVTVTLNPALDRTFAVDRVIPERKLEASGDQVFPGGGGINVARVACRLGAQALALWSCGGHTGESLAELLDDEQVGHAPVLIAGVVRENLIVLERACNQHFRFGMPGPLLSASERELWHETVLRHAADARFVVLSGSLPPGTPPEWYGELVRAIPRDVHVIADTKREPLRHALAAGLYLIKPNVHELEELSGGELDGDDAIVAAARALHERGEAEAVLVSLGRGGAMLVTATEAFRYAAPAVPLRSKVGAGDSMVGALVTALDRGEPLAEAVRYGVAAGAATVTTAGTELCRADDVNRLVKRVRGPDPCA